MKIGVDLDNTIINYDASIGLAVKSFGIEMGAFPATKRETKQMLVYLQGPNAWTEFQGYLYGQYLYSGNIRAFDGCLSCLKNLVELGFEIEVVSHKTIHPVLGPKYQLRDIAKAWLTAHGFFNCDRGPVKNINFCSSQHSKIKYINKSSFDFFIDDLAEVIDQISVKRSKILFNDNGQSSSCVQTGTIAVEHWKLIEDYLSSWV